MLTKRVIPCLDVKDGRVVKGVNFVNLRDAGDPVELAAEYDRQGADEVIFLDITATHEGRGTTIAMASRASEEVHIPYAVGGGFKTVADMRTMIAAGADKVSLNSAAIADPALITAGSKAFGSQAVLVAIDAKQVPGNSFATIFRFSIYCADIGCQVFSVMKVIFNHTQATDNFISIQTEIPSVLCCAIQIIIHTFQIDFRRYVPFLMKPFNCLRL